MALAACKASMAVRSSSPSFGVPASVAPRQRRGAVIQGLHMPGQSEDVGSRLLPSLRGMPLRSTDEHKGLYWSSKRRPGMAVVQATSIGVVQEVKPAAKEVYYNVVVRVPSGSEVAKWYTTPGMFVDMLPVESNFSCGSAYFIASPVKKVTTKHVDLEFLIEETSTASIANELINSKPGSCIAVTEQSFSSGFNTSEINSIEDFESVLMFASSYGLGPFRALIETGFYANKRKHAVLYTMYTPEQLPYADRFPAWEASGVKVQPYENEIISTNPAKTVVLLVASVSQQKKLTSYFESKGVPTDNIQTLFGGIPDTDYESKVLHKIKNYPKFAHLGEKHVSIGLKL